MAKRDRSRRSFEVRALLANARFRVWGLRARGVPAILCSGASIALAAGLTAALRAAILTFPETLRETRLLLATMRAERPELRG